MASVFVVPYIGTWIETYNNPSAVMSRLVVPYIGTWIETRYVNHLGNKESCRTLYRYVD